jgi:hypothetical protein
MGRLRKSFSLSGDVLLTSKIGLAMESLDGTATCASAPLNVKKQETKTSSAPLTDGRMERKADFNCRNT